jgi:hypothetical protein
MNTDDSKDLLKHSGYYMYHFNINELLHSTHTVYICFAYDSHKKQRLFAVNGIKGLICRNRNALYVLCEVRTKFLNTVQIIRPSARDLRPRVHRRQIVK